MLGQTKLISYHSNQAFLRLHSSRGTFGTSRACRFIDLAWIS